MKLLVPGVFVLVWLSGNCWGAEQPVLSGEKERVNYSVGYQIGGDFKAQGIELSPEILVKGIQDALGGGEPLMGEAEMHSTLVDLKKRIVAEQEKQRSQLEAKYREEGKAFLEQNAKKEGVVVLPSGLQYKIITPGTGKHPTLDDTITANYRGTRIDGSEFSNSDYHGKSDAIELSKVIPGLKEAIPMMKEGAKWEIFIPSNLAFGERGPLEGNVVIYEVELLSVLPKK